MVINLTTHPIIINQANKFRNEKLQKLQKELKEYCIAIAYEQTSITNIIIDKVISIINEMKKWQ